MYTLGRIVEVHVPSVLSIVEWQTKCKATYNRPRSISEYEDIGIYLLLENNIESKLSMKLKLETWSYGRGHGHTL